jgi:hypothetical protein
MRPDLSNAFTCLDIIGLSKDEFAALWAIRADFTTKVAGQTWNACYDLLRATYSGADGLQTVTEMKTTNGFIFAAFAVTIAPAPALKSLRMTTNSLDFMDFGSVLCNTIALSQAHVPQYHGGVRSLLQSRLEAIEVVEDPLVLNGVWWDGTSWREKLPPAYVNLGGFRWLKRAVIPALRVEADFRGYGPSTRERNPDIGVALPQSLEHVCFCWLKHLSVNDLSWLDNVIGSCLNLQSIELRFESNILSAAWAACSPSSQGLRTLNALRRWRGQSNIAFITTFGNAKLNDFVMCIEREAPTVYEPGDLAAAIERCLATTHVELETQRDLLDALGYEQCWWTGHPRS